MKSILDRSFRYTNAAETDLRKTFARIRRERAKAAEQAAAAAKDTVLPMLPMRRPGWPLREAQE